MLYQLSYARDGRNTLNSRTRSRTPTPADPALQVTLDELDPELAAMYKTAQVAGGSPLPVTGPPKLEEAEPEDLLVELIED